MNNRRTVRILITLLVLVALATSVRAQRAGGSHPPPTVSITSPAAGATFTAPATLNVAAIASAATGSSIKFVKIYAGSNQLCNDTKSPYTCPWAGVAAGTYTLTAVATDNDNLSTTSAAVVVTVSAPAPAPAPAPTPTSTPPSVSITSPGNGSSYKAPANVTISASASTVNTGAGIAKVAFYAGAVLIGTSSSSPFTLSWGNVASGKYSLTAVATDSTGATGTSPAVSVDVASAVNVPPTVSLTSPANGSSLTAPASISLVANAADSDGTIAQVAFYNGSTLIANLVAAPYSFAWNNVPAGTYTLTVQATDNAGATTTSASSTVTVTSSSSSPSTEPLLQPANLVYQGAFRVPAGTFGSAFVNGTNVATFEYGGTGLAFNPNRNSLFLVGHDWGQLVAEISIPAISNVTSLDGMATAAVLQQFSDPTSGALYALGPGYMKIGGLLPSGNTLYLSGFNYYDGANSQTVSEFVASTSLSQTPAKGAYQLGLSGFCGTSNGNCAGFVDGYLALVPAEWQKALGGPAVAGNCCLNIISRTSFGPGLMAFDPSQLGVTVPAPITPLVYYPQANPLSPWNSSGTAFNGATEIRGVVFPVGTRSVIFFGRHGLGTYCYGEGTADQSLAGQPTPDGTIWCYDPTSTDKGTHAYPYVYYAWAYDANDLAKVASGQSQPWQVQPYSSWALDLPFANAQVRLLGAAYDAKTQRIFLSEWKGDYTMPLIHVLSIQVP